MVPLRGRRRIVNSAACPPPPLPAALLFDCDGVLVDTEKDGHLISFNETFAERELGVSWDVDLYGELLKIGGGKERSLGETGKDLIIMVTKHEEYYLHLSKRKKFRWFGEYLNKGGWPAKAPRTEEERKDFISSLHKGKTELFMARIEKKLLPLRPGVARLIDEALVQGVKVVVCSTLNKKAAIYLLAANTLGLEPSSCVVVEDSAIGLAAAKAAGMKCIVMKSGYAAEEDFLTAYAVFDCIGDPPEVRFDLQFCATLLQKQYVS